MRFEINAKHFKELTDKVLTVMAKKCYLQDLCNIYLQIDENNNLHIWATDLEHWLEVRTKSVFGMLSPGVVGIDKEDIPMLTKLNGSFEFISDHVDYLGFTKATIKNGKKTIAISTYKCADIFLPSMEDTECLISLEEKWLHESFTKLVPFIGTDDKNKMTNYFNFNLVHERLETLDGQRITTRVIPSKSILLSDYNDKLKIERDFMIHGMAAPVMKKTLDKKSEAKVSFYMDKKYVKMQGKDFTYITRRADCTYLNVSSFMGYLSESDKKFSFKINKEKLNEIVKYDCNFLKRSVPKDHPLYFIKSINGDLHTYFKSPKYEMSDVLDVENLKWRDNFYIAFNPFYISDMLDVLDVDDVVLYGSGNKSPMYVDGKEYNFMILPVYPKDNGESARYFIDNKVA